MISIHAKTIWAIYLGTIAIFELKLFNNEVYRLFFSIGVFDTHSCVFVERFRCKWFAFFKNHKVHFEVLVVFLIVAGLEKVAGI